MACAVFLFTSSVALADDSNLNYDLMIDQEAMAKIESMNIPDMPDEVAAGLRGSGWPIKVIDGIGRVITVTDIAKFLFGNPYGSGTCYYSPTANSTVMYCL